MLLIGVNGAPHLPPPHPPKRVHRLVARPLALPRSGDLFILWVDTFLLHLNIMLVKKIRDEMTVAMKARDDLRVQTLRGALAAFTNELVAKGRKPTEELDDKDVVTVLKRLAKQRKEAAEQYEKGSRAELARKEMSELKIIEEYLPQMASREEIEKVVRKKMQELGLEAGPPAEARSAQAGKLTGVVMKEFAGRADGNDVKEVVASLFQ